MSKYQPSLGAIYIWSESPNYSLQCLLGDQAPKPTQGSQSYGGWETIKRKKKRSLVEWVGVEPLRMDISILIDNFVNGTSIEGEITQLERMAGYQRPGSPDKEPPLIQFNSAGVVPHDYHREPATEWVIENIEWGDSNRNSSGNRTRQAAILTVTQYIEDDELSNLTSAQKRKIAKAKNAKKKGKGAKGAKQARYVVKNGQETLESIAAKELGNSSRWHELKKLNPKIRDPTAILPPGTILVMPK